MDRVAYEFTARPSVAAYMTRAFWPGFLRRPLPFPPVSARWRAMSPDPLRLARFLAATGLERQATLPVTYLHVLAFPLQMVVLTAPAQPLPIWRVLQIRNRLLQHRPIPPVATLDAAVTVSSQRILEKGVELDLHLTVEDGAGVAWEALTTCYYRGRFGAPDPASPLAAPPPEPGAEIAAWGAGRGHPLRFAHASGDYNGVHTWGAYARLLGFRGAFFHPHAVVGQCLARLPPLRAPAQRIDLWFKGPVYHGSAVRLSAATRAAGLDFALRERDDPRPALLGRWTEAGPGESLHA